MTEDKYILLVKDEEYWISCYKKIYHSKLREIEWCNKLDKLQNDGIVGIIKSNQNLKLQCHCKIMRNSDIMPNDICESSIIEIQIKEKFKNIHTYAACDGL